MTTDAIDRDVWAPFTAAYPAYDVDLIAGTCAADLIHAGGPDRSAKRRDEHLAELAEFFQTAKARGDRFEVEFRFTERIVGDGIASERGIFRIDAALADGTRHVSLGRFHVFERLEADGRWRIVTDYDEGGATEAEFAAATPWSAQARGS